MACHPTSPHSHPRSRKTSAPASLGCTGCPHALFVEGQHLAPIDIFVIKKVKNIKKKIKSSHGTSCLCCLCEKPWGRKEHPGAAGPTVESGVQGPLPKRQRQPLCTGQSSRVSSKRLLVQPSPALHHSGTSSFSYLCKALEKHSCGLVGLKKGRAEGGRATACLLASPHPAHPQLYHS